MYNMSSLKTAMIIFAVICCSTQVRSDDPIISFKEYNFDINHLILPKDFINRFTLVYAQCDSYYQQTVSCMVTLEPDVFNENISEVTCDLLLETDLVNGIIEILQIDIWGDKKAIVTWRALGSDVAQYAYIGISTVDFSNCRVKEFGFKISNHNGPRDPIFIIPALDGYRVVYVDRKRWGNFFCKLTVRESRQVGRVEPWFPNIDSAHVLESIENTLNKLLITVRNTNSNTKAAKLHLLNDNGMLELGSYDNFDNLGWSTSNGFITYCTFDACFVNNYEGTSKIKKDLNLPRDPTYYSALYSMPANEYLALICDTWQENYRIIKIKANGHLGYSYDVEALDCSQKPDFLISKFFMVNNREYCLSVFHSVRNNLHNTRFATYCFSPWV